MPVTSAHAVGSATVYGNVGVPDVRIFFYEVGTGSASFEARSRSDGSYSVDGVEPGDYEIFVNALSPYVPAWIGGDEQRESARTVHVGEEATVEASAALARGGRLEGTVTEAGVAKAGVTVGVLRWIGGAWLSTGASVLTSSDGSYSYQLTTRMPVKLYALAGQPGTSAGQFRYFHGDGYSAETAPSVQPGADVTATGVDVDIPAVGMLTGRVVNGFGGPLAGNVKAWVLHQGQPVALETSWEDTVTTYTEPYTLAVPADVEVTVAGTAQGFATSWMPSAATPEDAVYQTVAAGETSSGNDVEVSGGHGIRGLLHEGWSDGEQRGVGGVRITAWSGETLMSSTVSDASGAYRLPGLGAIEVAPRVHIKIEREGLRTAWLVGNGAVRTTRPAAGTGWNSLLGQDNYGVDAKVEFLPDHELAVREEASLVNDVLGKPVTIRIPRYNVVPDRIEALMRGSDGSWHRLDDIKTTGDVAALTGADWSQPWYGDLRLTAVKANYKSVASHLSVPITRFEATSRPLTSGRAVAGQILTHTPASYNAEPDHIDNTWRRDGRSVGSARRYRLSTADVGRKVWFQALASYGTARTTTRSRAVTVKALSALDGIRTVKARSVVVSARLSTPGAPAPGGSITVIVDGARTKTVAVRGDGRATKVRVALAQGRHRIRLVYSGSPIATRAATRLPSVNLG
ncbi:hypothetical protein [Nocardioides sp. GXZ039]|uniref:hypothetical protein n=1 Tax=Nocardioides sp. GXZ039 TaxID=3136018 RepID=UPI0030F47656